MTKLSLMVNQILQCLDNNAPQPGKDASQLEIIRKATESVMLLQQYPEKNAFVVSVVVCIYYGYHDELFGDIVDSLSELRPTLVSSQHIAQTEQHQIEYDKIASKMKLRLLKQFYDCAKGKASNTENITKRLQIQDMADVFQSINKIRVTDNSYSVMAIETHKSKKPVQHNDVITRLTDALEGFRVVKNQERTGTDG